MTSSLGAAYRAFYQPLVDELRARGLVDASRATARPYQLFPSDYDGVSYGCVLMNVRGRQFASVYLWLKSDDRLAVFDSLEQSKTEIESSLGARMWWNRHDRDASHMGVEKDDCAITDSPEAQRATREWMLDWFPRLKGIMQPHLDDFYPQGGPL